jgi:hypothetical protein
MDINGLSLLSTVIGHDGVFFNTTDLLNMIIKQPLIIKCEFCNEIITDSHRGAKHSEDDYKEFVSYLDSSKYFNFYIVKIIAQYYSPINNLCKNIEVCSCGKFISNNKYIDEKHIESKNVHDNKCESITTCHNCKKHGMKKHFSNHLKQCTAPLTIGQFDAIMKGKLNMPNDGFSY